MSPKRPMSPKSRKSPPSPPSPPGPPRSNANKRGRNGADPLRNSIPGIALVLASMLPVALSRPPAAPPVTPPSSSATSTLAFKLGCRLPFDNIKTEGLAVDAQCSADGDTEADEVAERLEYNVKNNFCASGKPVPIVFDDFTDLQDAAANTPDLRKMLKTSRDAVTSLITSAGGAKIGEGTLVQFVAFLRHADFSNVGKGKGERVNCKLTTREDNDIHIQLVKEAKETDACKGVAAEMSPHFRPEAWSGLAKLHLENPVRVTGPLFYDGNHHAPCHDDVRPKPNRISVWEIHPVYQFEVCKESTLAACDIKKNSMWIPFDEWISVDAEDEP